MLTQGDITEMNIDAIVNAANNSLLGGGGVDGAIHKAAGEELYVACIALNGCKTGNAKITEGFKLLAKYIIHTVGPVWRGGNHQEAFLLSSCYKSSLEIAHNKNIKTIAFPNISTGVYGYPKKLAAEIAINTTKEFLQQNKKTSLTEIYFVCFDNENYEIYKSFLDA
jgi:O-acetyl-ADP-ribose deacetylase (regulator of RNase III)